MYELWVYCRYSKNRITRLAYNFGWVFSTCQTTPLRVLSVNFIFFNSPEGPEVKASLMVCKQTDELWGVGAEPC